MEPSALQYTILRLIEIHEAKGSATYLRDVDIASATNAALGDVQRQLVLLEDRGLVDLVKAAGPSYAASLTYHPPKLRLLGGRLRCFHHAAHQ
jgi:hypothetical protein